MQNRRAGEPDCPAGSTLAGVLGGVTLIVALLGAGCIQPAPIVDEFGTGGASSVTGDDAGAQVVDPGSTHDTADEEAEETADDSPSTTAAAPTGKSDAGVAMSDAGKPRGTDAGPAPLVDAGRAEPVSSDAGASPPTGGTVSKLSFNVTTSSPGGRYAPRNIYAIWIADAQGKFVKTLAKFAFIRARYLTAWNAASGGNVVDAVTGATVSNHGTRSVTWDLTDASKKPVPDGDYKLVIEMTDADRTGVSTSVPFSKGAPLKSSPPNQSSFSNMSLVLE